MQKPNVVVTKLWTCFSSNFRLYTVEGCIDYVHFHSVPNVGLSW